MSIVTIHFGFDRAAEGLLGAARRLGDEVHAVVIGDGAEDVARYADRVTAIDMDYSPEPCLNALVPLCAGAKAVLLANDTYSQELAPRLAYRLGGNAVGDGVAIDEKLRVTRQVYGGKAQAVIAPKRSPLVAWLRARSFAPAPLRDAVAEIERVRAAGDAKTKIIERKRETQAEARLEDARVIVSGGRGIGGPEGFATELQPLAHLLGAQMAASRAACDAGWVPPTWQVGQTGKKVAPELYLAIAITGASQHMAGISEAKNIAAINIDPDAPIFRHARFGIVEDYRKVVPLLREKLAKMK
ncbi:MAG TPA: electron transfer flavoprotein subunit alpha/FixB family protein [Thermoanaerobaculia bacterium]|jgi:electron transfer flavoprotein alpha subunit|nr:electron transfer flavoprotein subunit alpha/FixB family protein [Thermoanaerobaculia bacterium]